MGVVLAFPFLAALTIAGLVAYSRVSKRGVEREAASHERSPETGVIKGAEEFFFPGNSHACLLIHGFTSSLTEVRELGQYLAAGGLTVRGPLLPGHGTHPNDLEKVTWHDWYDAVEREYLDLQEKYETVSVAGISMGAALTLYLAQKHSPHKIVLLSPYLRVTHKWYYVLPPEAYVDAGALLVRYLKKPRLMLNDRAAWEHHIHYWHVPIKAVQQLMALGRALADVPPNVTCPALIVHSLHDEAASPDGAQKIHDALGSEQKRIVWLEKSNHIITLDYEKSVVNQSVLDFIKE